MTRPQHECLSVSDHSYSDLEPDIAKAIAIGDLDPITLLPMRDINPGYQPRSRVLKDVPLSTVERESNVPSSSKRVTERAITKPGTGTILDFFGKAGQHATDAALTRHDNRKEPYHPA